MLPMKKMKIQICKPDSILLLLLLASAAAHSDEITKRKSGLWETNSTVMGISSSMQECVDHDADNLIAQINKKAMSNCPVQENSYQNGKIVLHSVCNIGTNSVTTQGEITGDFNVAFTGHIVAHFAQPMNGMSQIETQINSKWIGACPVDRKPGSTIIQLPNNGGTIDMNDPRLKAMLENLKSSQLQQQK